MARTVSRKRLLESPEISLSGDRYREAAAGRANGKWPMVKLGEIASIISGGTPAKSNDEFWKGAIPWVSPKDMKVDCIYDSVNHISESALDGSTVKMAPGGAILCVIRSGILAHSFPVARAGRPLTFNQDINAIVLKDSTALPQFVWHVLRGMAKEILQRGVKKGGTVHSLHARFLHNLEIPLPPLEKQERIVAELEGYRKVIEGARQILASYKPTVWIDPRWPVRTVGDIASLEYGLTATGRARGDARLIRITDITDEGMLSDLDPRFTNLSVDATPYLLRHEDVLVARTGATYGKTLLVESSDPAVFASYLIRLRFSKEILPKFYWLFARSQSYWSQAEALVTGGGQPQFNGNALKQVVVPLPPLGVQRRIVAELEAERKLVEANRELIGRMEAKTKAKLAEV